MPGSSIAVVCSAYGMTARRCEVRKFCFTVRVTSLNQSSPVPGAGLTVGPGSKRSAYFS